MVFYRSLVLRTRFSACKGDGDFVAGANSAAAEVDCSARCTVIESSPTRAWFGVGPTRFESRPSRWAIARGRSTRDISKRRDASVLGR